MTLPGLLDCAVPLLFSVAERDPRSFHQQAPGVVAAWQARHAVSSLAQRPPPLAGNRRRGKDGTIVEIMLNLSKREQAKRFLKRIDHPDKNWKFSPGDVRERQHWDEYQRAFDAMLSQTSTEWAPWYVAPADRKWFGRLATAAVLAGALSAIDPKYPATDPAVRAEMGRTRAGLVMELKARQ